MMFLPGVLSAAALSRFCSIQSKTSSLNITTLAQSLHQMHDQTMVDYQVQFAAEKQHQLKKAAVVMPLVFKDEQWQLLYILRPQHMKHHKGQLAFPGGVYEKADPDLWATALRETWEEIGIPAWRLTGVGELPSMNLITEYCIKPYVAILDSTDDMVINPLEVERVVMIPLKWLSNADHYKKAVRNINGTAVGIITYLPFDGVVLWGATARMTLQLLRAIGLVAMT